MRYVRQILTLVLSTAAAVAVGLPTPLAAQQPKAAATPASQGPAPRIAYVNTQAILQQMPGYAQAESTMTAEFATARSTARPIRRPWPSAATARSC